jgi:hypothetical protein
MQSNLRIEKVIRSNSRMFALFEYTKLVIPMDNFLAVRSLQRDQRYDTILPIPDK